MDPIPNYPVFSTIREAYIPEEPKQNLLRFLTDAYQEGVPDPAGVNLNTQGDARLEFKMGTSYLSLLVTTEGQYFIEMVARGHLRMINVVSESHALSLLILHLTHPDLRPL